MKQETRKWLFIICIMLIAIGCYSVYRDNQFKKMEEEKVRLERENSDLNEKIKESKGESDNESCTFIKTFQVLQILKDYHVNPDNTFVVFDQFQMHSPFILAVPNEFVGSLEENKYYEISFLGQVKPDIQFHGMLYGSQIVSILETDKMGLEQTQENCK